MKTDNDLSVEDRLMKVALSRGIYFKTAEIFGDNISGFWEYGPTGLRIFNNLLSVWRKTLDRIGALEISGSSIIPRKVLQASGHEKNFFDVATTCEKCGSVYRADKLLEAAAPDTVFEGMPDDQLVESLKKYGITCEKCGSPLTNVRHFGSMFGLNAGAEDSKEVNAYLRPEACQSIFLDFDRVFKVYGRALPLTLAQVGKAYRNEISPRNSLIREREFYQNDIEIFFDDESKFELGDDREITVFDKKNPDASSMKISEYLSKGVIESKVTAYALSILDAFLHDLGFKREEIRYRKLYEDKAFYSKESFDAEIKKGDDWVEVTACNHRGDHDLAAYKEYGGSIVEIGGRIPQIFELSSGTDRLFYLLLYSSFKSDAEREWFELNASLSPYRAAVFPLMPKDSLDEIAMKIKTGSFYSDVMFYSATASIGKRYRRADEVGIKFDFTVDYQTKEDNTLTIRDRDTMDQFRMKVEDIDLLIKDSTKVEFSELKGKYAH